MIRVGMGIAEVRIASSHKRRSLRLLLRNAWRCLTVVQIAGEILEPPISLAVATVECWEKASILTLFYLFHESSNKQVQSCMRY